MDPVIARKTWRTLEPYHGLVYFAPEAAARYAALGSRGQDGYFASRAAPMGAVPAGVVEATFFNFDPRLVRRAIPSAWELASPTQWLIARLEGIDGALSRALGDEVLTSGDVERAAVLARIAAEACSPDGRPLHAAHAELPSPEQAHLALWHAISVLREHRGDGHIACLVEAGIGGCEALVLHAASGEVPRAALQGSRGWSDEDWSAAVEGLASRGLVDVDGTFTDAGRARRDVIEARTDALAVAPWATIGEDGCDELRRLVRPLSKAIVASGTFGLP
ncbi:MAG: hypothetical protein H0W25_17420 [Acidimicrobiia bacterium]|nr:hypothetical protein [Acidimicrobiia bacterium]